MNRHIWMFPYAADKLLEAATIKSIHHTERYNWWEIKKAEVMATIRAEGLEIDESQASEFSNKLSTYARQPTVQVRNDLLNYLNECISKVKEHGDKFQGYDAWIQVLSSQGQAAFNLHQDDWLYFFGK